MTSEAIKKYRQTEKGKEATARSRKRKINKLINQQKKRREFIIYKEDEELIIHFIKSLNDKRVVNPKIS